MSAAFIRVLYKRLKTLNVFMLCSVTVKVHRMFFYVQTEIG
jgi:hypothetical protein